MMGNIRLFDRWHAALTALAILAGGVLLQDIASAHAGFGKQAEASTLRTDPVELARLDIAIAPARDVVAEVEAGPIGILRINASSLNHRACGSLDCTVLDGSPRGTVREYYEVKDGWVRLTPDHSERPLWASRQYVTEYVGDTDISRFADAELKRGKRA